MALFRKKEPEDGADAEIEPRPEDARKWFDHAKAAADTSNFAYALECFACGIRLDPAALSAHKLMWDAAVRYMNQDGKSAKGKEVRGIDDGTPAGKFAAAEFEWMKDIRNHKHALRALDAAVKADQLEVGNWLSPRVFNLIRGQSTSTKLSKNFLLQAMELFSNVGAWEASLTIGEMARELDPLDGELDMQLKNLSAQRAMDQGGYDNTAGQEGGFRKHILDADKQQDLVEQELLAANASIGERNLERARRAYEEAPTIPDSINRYAQLLKKQATPEAEKQAYEIYEKGFKDTDEYRFRMACGDMKIEQLERKLRDLDEKVSNGADPGANVERDAMRQQLMELKSSEYAERVAKYPTDRIRRFELGTVRFDMGDIDSAMADFQSAKDEPKLRVRAGHMLGRCFFAEEWYNEAIEELTETLRSVDGTERERELALRYDLMLAQLASARQEQSVDLAKEARSICSEIARKDITYRDIRSKRKEVEELIKSLS